MTAFSAIPEPTGLYDPANEHDACGLAMIAALRGGPTHDVVAHALTALRNLEHRGAVGAAGAGDGAGISLQIPHDFFTASVDFTLPELGAYAAGMGFLNPADPAADMDVVERLAVDEGLRVLGWRVVPVDGDVIGEAARAVMPEFRQVFLDLDPAIPAETDAAGRPDPMVLARRAFAVRKRAEHDGVYFPSLSPSTIVYKGMVTTAQLEPFYPDLSDESLTSKLAIVHSRFSTNTFPSWQLAQPFRMIAHNGEINTIRGNRNWMHARETSLSSELLASPRSDGSARDVARLLPINAPGASDSASFDEVLELLAMSGRSLPHAVMMMIPEAWERDKMMAPATREFYEFHSMLMEPWDGPACVTFTDGRVAGAVLDRNGLRPARYQITDDGLVVLASEVGVLDLDPARIVSRGRLKPGRMFLIDTVAGRLVGDEEIKAELAGELPYGSWLDAGRIRLTDLPDREHVVHSRASVTRRQATFGYTEEELRILLAPMARNGAEPLGAMGTDTPIAVLSERPRLLFDYFAQSFAQVTNPPLDAIREELVTSLAAGSGNQPNLLTAGSEHCRQVILPFPVIDNDELAKLVHLDRAPGPGRAGTIGDTTVILQGLFKPETGGVGLARRLEEICTAASAAVEAGARFLVLSDRDSTADLAPIPSLLLTSAVHHHLIRERTRTRVGLLVEAGDVREVHHVAVLIGYGASAVNPYLAMESAEELVRTGRLSGQEPGDAVRNLITALGKGVLKIMSKMGISTVLSYRGAQTFEALGLGAELVDKYFTGTTSQLGGIGLDVLAGEVAVRHARAYPDNAAARAHRGLDVGGEYQWRREGPPHLFNPETVFRLQHATRSRRYDIFRQYTRLVDDQAAELMTLRGLFSLRQAPTPVPLDEVEPVESIVKRFATGAMSYGSISKEAHENLAIAMNRLGGKSNTGEGGEDIDRLLDPERRSAVKQIASGRFGVTSLYLTNADDIQIKMAQGAKPGEGGQLPPSKVYPWIASTRHATPGVGLISPPPHHDIYSIEDLAQLIYDLGHANPEARVHVKLVSQIGIGAVASGVAKARADVVLISGHDGGTGASPLNSLKHAGVPWELGLAEAQQTLALNGLRDRIVVQVDGQLKTGRDVVIAALLGAEEFGFATAPLVVSGCIMMRVCHLDTCPVGVATQNPELRARFTGKPEFVVNFFTFLAEEVREHLAALGLRSLDEAIGRTDLIDTRRAVDHWKASGLDVSPILAASRPDGVPLRRERPQPHDVAGHFDQALISGAADTFTDRLPVKLTGTVRNIDRSVGTLLGHEVTKTFGVDTLDDDTIDVALTGSAGQSFGAFVPAGITLRLAGDANDYVGKGLSGGCLVLAQDPRAGTVARENVIAGNVVGYGATSGSLFISGQAGERFLVRGSGVTAVVEGIGDHGCEYMTGGRALILGAVGRNFAAGMSGGVAYLLDFDTRTLNTSAVAAGELHVSGLDGHDLDVVTDLLRRHVRYTGSAVATTLLVAADAGKLAGRMTKVLPRDYAAVLETRRQSETEGLDPDGQIAWKRILEVTHG